MSEEPIWSYGGAGGIGVRLADLERVEQVLALASGELDDAMWTLAAAARSAGPTLGDASSVVGAAAGAARAAGECRALSRALRAAMDEYVEAERQASAGLSIAARTAELAQDVAGTAWWEARWLNAIAAAVVSPLGLPSLLMEHGPRRLAPAGLPPHTSWLNGETSQEATAWVGEDYDRLVVAVDRAFTAAEALEPDYAGVIAEPGARPVVLRDPGVEGAMRRLRWTEKLGGGAVVIETITAMDGSRRHVVYIPGTQDWGVTDPNPADAQANLVAVRGGLPDAARVVRDALAAHGVAPEEPVMLAGHSQGGLIAAVGAGALGGGYRIAAVLTAGSPTGRLSIPSGVATLHLENTRDVVPGLDGRVNPDTRDRVTVVHDRRRSRQPDPPDGSRTVGEAHGLDGYAATGREVDRGGGRSVRAWVGAARQFLGGGGSALSVYRPAP